MLDAYIIDRIRRERDRARRDGAQVPLHIEPPRPDRRPPVDGEAEEKPERGSVIIDFHV